MNNTEARALNWLERKGYSSLTFQNRRSPDFLAPDGIGFEVKKERNGVIVFTESQWEALTKHPNVLILVFNNSTEPLATIPFSELTKPPSFWRQFRLAIYDHGGYFGNIIDSDKYKNVEEVATIVGVHRNTVENWLWSGKLKGVRAGKLWRISTESLDEFLKKENSEGKQ